MVFGSLRNNGKSMVAGAAMSALPVALVVLSRSGILPASRHGIDRPPSRLYDAPPYPQPLCAQTAIVNLCGLCGIETDLIAVVTLLGADARGTTLSDCRRALLTLGLPCDIRCFNAAQDLPRSVPALCVVHSRDGLHAVVAVRASDRVLIVDGSVTRVETLTYLSDVAAHVAIVPRSNAYRRDLRALSGSRFLGCLGH